MNFQNLINLAKGNHSGKIGLDENKDLSFDMLKSIHDEFSRRNSTIHICKNKEV
jgi:hypothetical protein